MINVGIIGYGYWGPNVARNFNASKRANLIAICDLKQKRLDLAKSHYPFIEVFSDANDLISSENIDVVAVVTPVFSRYELAKMALEYGKHVFVEKPFTSNVAQGEKLINLADKKNLKIMVDHTFLFTGAVRKMREIVDSGELQPEGTEVIELDGIKFLAQRYSVPSEKFGVVKHYKGEPLISVFPQKSASIEQRNFGSIKAMFR